MSKLLGGLAALLSSLAAPADGNEARPPIQLVTDVQDHVVRINVVGSSSTKYEASFSLEVTSEGNRSIHRGSVELDGGQPVLISTVTVGIPASRPWRAHLRVEPRGLTAYEQVASSS